MVQQDYNPQAEEIARNQAMAEEERRKHPGYLKIQEVLKEDMVRNPHWGLLPHKVILYNPDASTGVNIMSGIDRLESSLKGISDPLKRDEIIEDWWVNDINSQKTASSETIE